MSSISSNNYPIKGRKLDLDIKTSVELPNNNVTPVVELKQITYAEWKMVIDDFDDGVGNRELPHCTNCGRGVYNHDAGKWCTFCGAMMKNPIAL